MAFEQTGVCHGSESLGAFLHTADWGDRRPGDVAIPSSELTQRHSRTHGRVELQASCVDRHSHHCIDAEFVELIDLFLTCDSTCRDELRGGEAPQLLDYVDRNSFQQSFVVNVGV